jgi:uncharacterized membrane protein YqjE
MTPSRLSVWRLLRLLALPRSLLLAHARAYGQLASSELAQEWARWRRGVLLQGLGLLGLLGAAGLAGVALMLWAVLPMAQAQAPWVLWLVPLLAAVCAGGCLWAADRVQRPPAFAGLRRQWAADQGLLRGRPAVDAPLNPGVPRRP